MTNERDLIEQEVKTLLSDTYACRVYYLKISKQFFGLSRHFL